MPSGDVVIIPTGAANIASMLAAFARLGAVPRLATSAADILAAPRVVLPGVGSFGAASEQLRSRGWFEAVRDRWNDPRPALGICLGLQLLFEASDESPGVRGLGVVPGRITRLATLDGRTPYFGWSTVREPAMAGEAYFAHSYGCRQVDAPHGWRVAAAGHAREGVVGAMWRHAGRHLACQFHPELSGSWGLELLRAWLDERSFTVSAGAACSKAVRVIPCLDVRHGRVVKGVQFESLRDAGDPATRAGLYERSGADELVMLDVGATPEGREVSLETVRLLRRELSIPLTVGGGIRAAADAAALLDAGADKVAVNTAAVRDPSLISQLASRFGAQCVVLAIDAKAAAGGGWRVRVRSGSEECDLDAVRWASQGASLGAGEILLTSVDRDGTNRGYDLELIQAVSKAARIPVIASGGGASAPHMSQAIAAGADAVLAASIFHDGVTTVRDIKRRLRDAGHAVRLDDEKSVEPSSVLKEISAC